MDAIEYFFTQSLLFVAVLGLVFFLLGMFFGTLLSAGLRTKLKECRDNLADCQTSSAKLKSEITELKEQAGTAGTFTPSASTTPEEETENQETTPAPSKDESPADEESDPAPATDDDNPFAALIASGAMTLDDKLGAIYSETPDDPDDLTKIKGVGKSINTKLNKAGIYKFQQIAHWTEPVCNEFATRLAFKDRILREDWPAQAKALQNEN